MRILVSGAAGFIGYHTSAALLSRGDDVAGLDNLNAYYDVRLKQARLERLEANRGFCFFKADLADASGIRRVFEDFRPDRVVHLGAQAGVRYSLEDPEIYAQSNVVGTLHVLEECRKAKVSHLVVASTSSVYGANTSLPFSVRHNVDHPLSPYAATKKAAELLAHSHAHLFGLPVTVLRFFTVYGPWGRPDMALFKFTKAMLAGEPIEIYNNGHHARDFTYIDDIVEGVLRTLDRPAQADPLWDSSNPNPQSSSAPYRVYNIGNDQPVELMDLVASLERRLGRTAEKRFLPMQPGDVPSTWANIDQLVADTGFRPGTSIDTGVARFVDWYLDFYR